MEETLDLSDTSFRHIHLIRKLGAGGMGEVYEAVDEHLGRHVAVKVLRPERALHRSAKQRFLREAKILSRLDHPNICRVLDYFEEEGRAFLILELIKGNTLDQHLKNGIDQKEKWKIALQVAHALTGAHAMSVIHRDLKPENIMISESGDAVVLDFGLARTGEDPEQENIKEDQKTDFRTKDEETLTLLGDIMGTPRFMSPEQARGEFATAASDIYSLGLILQWLFTESSPYDEGLPAETILRKAQWGDTRAVHGLSRHLSALIEKLKAPRAEDRPTAAQALEGLQRIVSLPRRRIQRGVAAVIIMLLALAAVISTLGFLTARKARKKAESSEQQAQKARDEAIAVNDFLRNMLSAVEPGKFGLDVRVSEVLDQAAATVDSEFSDHPDRKAAILDTLGATYSALGKMDQARVMLDKALEVEQSLDSPSREKILRIQTHRLLLLHEQSRDDEAESKAQTLHRVCDSLLGEENPTCLDIAEIYGAILQKQRHFEKARDVYEKLIPIRQTHAEESPSAYLRARVRFAGLLRNFDDPRIPEMLENNLREARKSLGPAHPTTLAARTALFIYSEQKGDYEKAGSLSKENLKAHREVFGPLHPKTLNVSINHCIFLIKTGHLEEAESLLRDLLEKCRKTLGESHLISLAALHTLAWVLSDSERYQEATSLYVERVEICRRAYGKEHRLTLEATSGLAAQLMIQGDLPSVQEDPWPRFSGQNIGMPKPKSSKGVMKPSSPPG